MPTDHKYILSDGDIIRHHLKKEEGPILNIKPVIICDNENYLVVSKPPSWPVLY